MSPNGAARGDEMALSGTYMSGSKQVDMGQGSDEEHRATSHVRGWQAGTIHGQPAQSLHDPSVAMAGKDYLAALNAEQRRAA